jgi:hypothetical protein
MVEREADAELAHYLRKWGKWQLDDAGGNITCVGGRNGSAMVKAADAIERLTALHPTQPVGEPEGWREAIRAEIINTPETADFMAGVPLEAAHQRERWSVDHDAGKTPFDWFWLIGYLAQKAASAQIAGNTEKAKHHTISTAAALANWHAQLDGLTAMRPGIGPDNGGQKLGSAHAMAAALASPPTNDEDRSRG